MRAFEITVDDVLTVLSNNAKRVKSGQHRDLSEFAAIAFTDLDMTKIERAALAHATDLNEQTEGAHEEIERQLVDAGVMLGGASGEVAVGVSLNVIYREEGSDGERIKSIVDGVVASAVGGGLLEADGYGEVITWDASVDVLSTESRGLDEDDIAQWLESRVEDGELSVEDLARLAARYALANRAQLLNEIAERIAMRAQEEAEGQEEKVSAQCWSDDRAVEVDFSAAPWLAQGGAEDIVALAACGWRGDYAADKVAEWEAERNGDVAVMFDYIQSRLKVTNSEVGFECAVDQSEAKSWLFKHRRDVWAQVVCEEAGVNLVEAQEQEIASRWDWTGPNGSASEMSLETRSEAAINAAEVLGL